MSSNSIFDKFTRQYSVNKTLRFRLIPVGKTEDHIKKNKIIWSQWKNNESQIFGQDAIRAKNYKIVKQIIDEVHRAFIQEALSQKNIDQYIKESDLKCLYDSWQKNRSNKNNLKEYNKKKEEYQINLAKGLEELFKQTVGKWKEKYPDLNPDLEKKDQKDKKTPDFLSPAKLLKSPILKNMINEDKISIIKKDSSSYAKDELEEALKSFDQFATYFEGFRKNRENIYNTGGKDNKNKLKAGSVAHRLFECNLQFHFRNIEKWQTIRKSINDLQGGVLQKYFEEAVFNFNLNELFQPASFLQYLSQSGINRYNEILGGSPAQEGEEKQRGLNGIINEIQQRAQSNRRNFPFMQEFYKQILSKEARRFIDMFNDDKEMLEAIESFYQTIQSEDLLKRLKRDIEKHFDSLSNDDLKEHYLSRDTIRTLSKNIFLEEKKDSDNLKTWDSWKILDDWWIKYVDEEMKSDRDKPLSESVKEKEHKKKYLSFFEIQKVFQYLQEKGEFNIKKECQDNPPKLIQKYITNRLDELILQGWKNQNNEEKQSFKTSWDKLDQSRIFRLELLDKNNEKREKQIALIKEFLDACSTLHRFIRSLTIKDLSRVAILNETWQEILEGFTGNFPIMNLYNKVRNRVTQKPYITDKIKVNFKSSTLLKGWSRNDKSRYQYSAVLLRKDKLFYLGIVNKDNRRNKDIFNQNQIIKTNQLEYYDLMIHNSLDVKKQFPRIFKPSEEVKKTDKSHIKFTIEKLKNHSWRKKFNLSFKDPKEYSSYKDFCNEMQEQAYIIEFEKIPKSYIDKYVENDKLYLFQIYNKDFSRKKKSKGKDNLHTLYWKSLFEKVKEDIINKLGGGAEIFYRNSILKNKTIHQRNKPIKNKNPKNHKEESVFSFDIVKDKRFTENQFLFHVPIILNYKNNEKKDMNLEVNKFLRNHNEQINIIGIDRGEKNLLYYCVINQRGDIIEQNSLNTIIDFYVNEDNNKVLVKYDYHKKLDEVEGKRDQTRKEWGKIENIKELKSGYLSQVVHKLACLIIKHNAVVVLEDLNQEFKNFRKKVEKQVYQNFEKALINKLNYLVFKKTPSGQAGHYLNAYQLTGLFKSFDQIEKDKQSGILFYTTAAYTSVTDPMTGFLKNVYYDFTNIGDSQRFWEHFDVIRFNKDKDYFEFTYTIGKVKSRQFNKEKEETKVKKKQWTVCSCVTRSYYDKDKKKSLCLNIHEKIKELLDQDQYKIYNINYSDGNCFKDKLVKISDSKFHKQMIKYFNLILNVRVKDDSKSNEREKDYILSPVEPFFDSRKASRGRLPIDSDANGAYNIARKGICILKQIKKSESEQFNLKPMNKKDWQDYAQSGDVVAKQKEKL